MSYYETDARGRLVHATPLEAAEEILRRADLALGPIHVQHYAKRYWGWRVSRPDAANLLRTLVVADLASSLRSGRHVLYLHHTKTQAS